MTKLLVFDSGVGGLSVAREIRLLLPDSEIAYIADDAGFPYGNREAEPLNGHVLAVISDWIDRLSPEVVVIACNTASTLVLPNLRARHTIPFVGTVPAIKPAAEQTKSGLISVLATVGTMRRDYTRDLIQTFAHSHDVRLVGSDKLAPLAEDFMRGQPVDDAALRSEILPAFVEKDGRRTDTIVLACTHYPFLIDHFRRVAPWPVAWIDPAPAIARRVADVVDSVPGVGGGGGCAKLTSGKPWSAAMVPLLRDLGLEPEAIIPGDGPEPSLGCGVGGAPGTTR